MRLPSFLVLTTCATVALSSGCSRSHYRLRADRDSYTILHQKTDCAPWQPENDFTVYPRPDSRLYNNPVVDCPTLPNPSPQLYEYELPPIPDRDPERFRPQAATGRPANERQPEAHSEPIDDGDVRLLPEPEPETDTPEGTQGLGKWPRPQIQMVAFHQPPNPKPDLSTGNGQLNTADGQRSQADESTSESLPVPKKTQRSQTKAEIPIEYWNSVPRECLSRMLEFNSIREEYLLTFGEAPIEDLIDDSPRLALEDIIDLAHLNSRDLQSQKETLYSVALALTLERFQYQLKPSVGGNRTAANYRHNRVAGITDDTLSVPTGLQLDRMLWTGGDILARFSNSVILTFNGPQGFAADVGSDLFFDISQSILQRDILLESLTQAERDVIYQARDYARFRKQLFVDLATQYYALIRQFRQIEINTQNYFTLVREFRQTTEEYHGGFAPRFQLDQIEQQVINGRRQLLSS
ncbi:MAG: hypothetical protein KDB27_32095, partial [Planctomycetales bacterium]|nr:hypothetical protein [Planctomycetales bacterium]